MQVKNKLRGITLIELMVAIAIIGIIGAIAYPSYVDYVREARRADAISQLLTMQMAQEEWRLRNAAYAELADLPITVNSEFYNFSTSNIGAETYTLTATATGGQANDAGCEALSLNQNDQRTPADCWN
ncbi:MAG TPA: type IV pilin protein [Pseudidiomarina sp.]|nr:type IV pilin protein [Pseudidiomarina sp.]